MAIIRNSWFRLLIVGLALASVNSILIYAPSAAARGKALTALQSSTLLFAICAALSIALVSNYVKGLRETYLKRVSNVRDMLEKFFDNHNTSNDPDIKEILVNYILPLLYLSTREWLMFDPIKDITKKITKPLEKLHARDYTFLPRHLLRIEDEINEIGLLYIRRICSDIHLKTISGTFGLVAVGIIALGFLYLLPTGISSDLIVVSISTTIVVLAVLELLLILSYLQQEGREEQVETSDEDNSCKT